MLILATWQDFSMRPWILVQTTHGIDATTQTVWIIDTTSWTPSQQLAISFTLCHLPHKTLSSFHYIQLSIVNILSLKAVRPPAKAGGERRQSRNLQTNFQHLAIYTILKVICLSCTTYLIVDFNVLPGGDVGHVEAVFHSGVHDHSKGTVPRLALAAAQSKKEKKTKTARKEQHQQLHNFMRVCMDTKFSDSEKKTANSTIIKVPQLSLNLWRMMLDDDRQHHNNRSVGRLGRLLKKS